jgi:hypothetical protein
VVLETEKAKLSLDWDWRCWTKVDFPAPLGPTRTKGKKLLEGFFLMGCNSGRSLAGEGLADLISANLTYFENSSSSPSSKDSMIP